MIEKIVENWLIKSSEKSYQLPFCFLLMQQGKTILHMTRHSAMEHGKDIIAVDGRGQVHAYQLKGIEGQRLSLSGWQKIIDQVMQLVYTPCSHPSIKSKKYHKSYLVINGDIDEEVQHAITMKNNQWEQQGQTHYKIHTIVKGQLLQMALDAKDMFMPTEVTDYKALLEFQLDEGIGFLNKKNLSLLLAGVLDPSMIKSENEFKRRLTSSALLCSLATVSFEKQKNHFALIEAWTIHIFCMFQFIERTDRNIDHYKKEITLSQQVIVQSLKDLLEELKDSKELITGNPLTDAFVYRYRTTMMIGMMAFLGIIERGYEAESVRTFIESHLNDASLWGEASIPFAIAPYFYYVKKGQVEEANNHLTLIMDRTLAAINGTDIFFPDIYVSAEDAVQLLFDEKPDEDERPTPRIGYVLESLVILLSTPAFENTMRKLWPAISQCIFTSVGLDQSYHFYDWRTEGGEYFNLHPELTQSWAQLQAKAKAYEVNKIPQGILKYGQWLPLFLMVYPHRLHPNLIKWYAQTELTQLQDLKPIKP